MSGNKSTIGAVCLVEGSIRRELSFEEILLDETLMQGHTWILKDALRYVGGINYRLDAKRSYELLIRIAKEYTVLQLGLEDRQNCVSMEQDWLYLGSENQDFEGPNPDEEYGNFLQALRTDCYLIGRYKSELLELGCFDEAVLGVVEAGGEDIAKYLEGMLSGSNDFYHIYDCTQPILIYRGSDLCYSILDTFARYMGDALEVLGQKVEYFDVSAQPMEALAAYMKRRYKAVIGMQTDMFSLKWQDGRFAHDGIAAPKYQFVFDHPIRMIEHLQQVSRNLCILVPDGNYKKFIEGYYGHSTRFLPPAGKVLPRGTVMPERSIFGEEKTAFCENIKKEYDLVFLGSYYDGPIGDLQAVRSMDKKRAYLLNRYILYMRTDLKMTPEEALKRTLADYGIVCDKEEFKQIMHRERWVTYCLSYHYRNKVIWLLLNAGIAIHVFGDTWKQSPMWGHPQLIWHEAVMGEEALEVYAKSKLSLNIMTWHKDGFTERIANAMLQKSVVVTDRTTYLEENFENGRELLMFDLGQLGELPGQIKELLSNEEKRAKIAECVYQKALKYHTWDARAKTLLQWIEEDRF